MTAARSAAADGPDPAARSAADTAGSLPGPAGPVRGPGVPTSGWTAQMNALGDFIRAQRQLANLSLREMASMTSVSNAYLSQVERGLHQPSLRVLRSIADALNLSSDTLLSQAGMAAGRESPDGRGSGPGPAAGSGTGSGAESGTEAAIRRDPELGPEERETLLHVYRSLRRSPGA
jgi:transcriptional regulator with XRE-family HTH domain